MARPQKGAVWFDRKRGYWVAQLNWTDDAGKRKQRKRKIENKSAGWDLIDDWKAELKQQGPAYLDAETITFAQLAAEYEEKRLVPAEYRDGKKVKGMRDWKNARTRLKMATKYFAKKRIRNITYADVENFRDDLLTRLVVYRNKKGEITKSKERSIADVNRILARLSGAFTYAFQKEWITRSPFSKGDTLIVMSQESPRERILSMDEQRKLLQACQNADRRHLYPVILTALDSGCRRGELLKLRWCDVSLEKGELHVTATNAKTNRARTIDLEPITIAELRRLWDISPRESDGLVFGIKTNFTRAWRSALKAAEIITPTRFHDLRATAITFWLVRGMGMEFAMRRSGHTDPRIFMRYVRTASEIREKQRTQLKEWELASSLAELASSESVVRIDLERSGMIN